MSLSLALNTSLTGLNVNQQALAVLSQNIANVNTPGYSRKILNQSAQSIAGVGQGVRADDITRRVDQYLIQAVRLQSSAVGKADVVREYADRTQLMLGNPGSSNSLNSYINTFFNSLQSLSQTPEDATVRAGVTQSATVLAAQFSQLAQGLQDLRYQADQDIYAAVSDINTKLLRIDGLNKAIVQNKLLGRTATELLDERDTLLNDVSTYMELQTFERADGSYNVATNGVPLVDDDVYQLSYEPASSSATFINDETVSAIKVYRSNQQGELLGNPQFLTTSATSGNVVSVIANGKIRGFLDTRDRQVPSLLEQLDVLAYTFKDKINAAHNAGTSFPGANSYVGGRLVAADDAREWAGSVRIAVLGSDGQPVASNYSSLPGGLPPLTIDLSALDDGSGVGTGQPTVQTIIDEINQYYGAPQKRVSLGPLTNIRLASGSSSLPGSPAGFTFDLDLENISGLAADVFVTDIQVLDDTSADISSVTQGAPSVAIATSNSFVTTNSSNVITVNTTSAHGLTAGDTIFLPDISAAVAPALDINGIPFSELSDQYFTISNVTATSFQITATSLANASSGVNGTGATILPSYSSVTAGESGRTTTDGQFIVDLTGNSTSSYYTVNMSVGVVDENGLVRTSVISYRVDNNQNYLLNDRYPPTAATGNGTIVSPTSNQAYARAMLVDADGNELPRLNGQYVTTQDGYLKIVAGNSNNAIAIDSLDSAELGDSTSVPIESASNRGFSYYFGLNNFFTDDGATDVNNTALNMVVDSRLITNPNLLSTGRLSLIPALPGQSSAYTYEMTIGDQSNVNTLLALGSVNSSFSAAGGIGASTQTFGGYAAQMIGLAATSAEAAKGVAEGARLLQEGYSQRERAAAGVNLDEELANTVIYQNAYTASARVVTVVNTMFDALLNAVVS